MKQQLTRVAMDVLERGWLPDSMIRKGIRSLVRERLTELPLDDPERAARHRRDFVAMMNHSPVAPVPELANEQHYEVPAEFYGNVLGSHRKYSSCFWDETTPGLDEAEALALEKTCRNADLEDGQEILELGCGWGALTLWMAAHYPSSRIVAVSNSRSQRRYIEQRAAERGLGNLQVITADMNDFSLDRRFDRVVSVEMFEHMRNYGELFRRINLWLKPRGLFLMHIFCHRDTPYEFVDRGASDWMSRHFFSGGIMPSDDLPLAFQQDLTLRGRWTWNGRHYQQTAEAWLRNMDINKPEVMETLRVTYGDRDAERWWMRWRVFFMACAELFGYEKGEQWHVNHYLFEPRGRAR
jgi:cyclopropane-fatty-acyl-phospholipid synthase